MTTMTDLTQERLDELERKYKPNYPAVYIDNKTARSLIAMARAKQAAERERDVLRDALVTVATHAMTEHSCGDPDVVAALAQPSDALHSTDAAPGITLSRTEEMWGASCDWGHCDGSGAGFRWCADLSEWLPVCAKHLMAPHGDAQPTDAGGAK